MEKVSQRVSNKIANMGIVCAVLVVAIHCGGAFEKGTGAWWLHEIIGGSLGKIAVPYFFCVAGFLLAGSVGETGWLISALKKRFRSLLVPFFFWNVGMLVVAYALIVATNFIGGRAIMRNVASIPIWRELGFVVDSNPINEPLWFVRSLFFLVVASPLLAFLARKRMTVTLLCGLLALATILFHVQRGTCVLVDLKLFGLQYDDLKATVYFVLGMHLRLFGGALPFFAKTLVVVMFFLTWGGTVACDFLRVPFAFQFSQLFIPYGAMTLWMLVPDAKWPSELTNLSFPIYCVHYPVQLYYALIPHASYLKVHRGDSAMLLLLYFVFVLIASWCVILMMRRFGTLSSIAFGGRAERKIGTEKSPR